MLDPTQQRVVGVLLEKELSVPESYPMTENALLAGCNQKSNRDPEMGLEPFELNGALLALREDGWAARVEGGRAAKYRHRVEDRLNLRDTGEKAVLAELLLRGPQAPGELARRVGRMGFHADAAGVRDVLERLATRSPSPLVEELPHRPRERDQRWAHRLGERPEHAATTAPAPSFAPPPDVPAPDDLTSRVARLEAELQTLRSRLDALETRQT